MYCPFSLDNLVEIKGLTKKSVTYLNYSFIEVHTPSDDLKILYILPLLTVWLYLHSLQPILVRH